MAGGFFATSVSGQQPGGVEVRCLLPSSGAPRFSLLAPHAPAPCMDLTALSPARPAFPLTSARHAATPTKGGIMDNEHSCCARAGLALRLLCHCRPGGRGGCAEPGPRRGPAADAAREGTWRRPRRAPISGGRCRARAGRQPVDRGAHPLLPGHRAAGAPGAC